MGADERQMDAEQGGRRREVEGLPCREAFALQIEQAQAEGEGGRKVRGVANTFGVMRSGRIIHPAAVEAWLEANPQASLPLLAQHGYMPTFATIGRVTALKASRAKGLTFEAEMAEGTQAADEAWTLIRQGMLAGVSIGWIGRQARWVRKDDVDLDPWLARKMKEAGVEEAYAFMAIELVEVSIVDVQDDRGAKLAARFEEHLNGLESRIEAGLKAIEKALERHAGTEARRHEGAEGETPALPALVRAECNAWAQQAWPELRALIIETVVDAAAARDEFADGLEELADGAIQDGGCAAERCGPGRATQRREGQSAPAEGGRATSAEGGRATPRLGEPSYQGSLLERLRRL